MYAIPRHIVIARKAESVASLNSRRSKTGVPEASYIAYYHLRMDAQVLRATCRVLPSLVIAKQYLWQHGSSN
jgi:hypothetical protein